MGWEGSWGRILGDFGLVVGVAVGVCGVGAGWCLLVWVFTPVNFGFLDCCRVDII